MSLRKVLLVAAALVPAPGRAQTKAQGFVIDRSRPYVYLKFDHIGKWSPISAGEPHEGIWLRLVNNCRIPIVVAIFGGQPAGVPGTQTFDRVVPESLPWGVAGGLYPGQKPPKPPKPPPVKPPAGYAEMEVYSTTIIRPGDNLLLAFPANHVSPWWYMRIRFNLEVPGEFYGALPYSVLEFHWDDIPADVRTKLRPSDR